MNKIKFYAGSLNGIGEHYNYFLGTSDVSLRDRYIYQGYLFPASLVPYKIKKLRSADCIPTYDDSGDLEAIKYTSYYE